MTKALLFDLGNVLVGFDFRRGYDAIRRLTGLENGEIQSRIAATEIVHPYERGEVSNQEFHRRLSDALGLTLSFDEFCDLWTRIFLPDPLVPEALIEELHRRHRLVLLSNTNDIHFRMIARSYPLLRHFDALVLSYRVGAMKPSEKIYSEAVRAAGCAPEECFYTDDVLEFVESGRRFGLDAVQFTGAEGLHSELRSRGILK